MARTLADLLIKLGMDTTGFQKGMAKAQRGLKNAFGAEALAMSQGVATGFAVLGAALVGVGVASVKMAADMQVSKTAFTKLLGSSEAATDMLKDLERFARDTPFEMPGLINSSKRLLAFRFAAQDIIPIMAAVGDAVGLMGGGQEAIDGIVRALGQISAKGKLSAQEVNQLAEHNINAWKYVAKELGVSIPEAMKMTENGAVDSTTAINGIIKGMQTEFKGGMDLLSKEIPGLMSTIKDNVGSVMRDIGKQITEALDLKKVLQTAADDLAVFSAAVQQSGVQAAMRSLIPPEIMATVFALSGALLAVAIPAVIAFGLTATVATVPLWGLIAAGAAFGLVANQIWRNWEPLSNWFNWLMSSISSTMQTAWETIKYIWYSNVQSIMKIIQPLTNLIGGSLQTWSSNYLTQVSGQVKSAAAGMQVQSTRLLQAIDGIEGARKSFSFGLSDIALPGGLPQLAPKPNLDFDGLHNRPTPTLPPGSIGGASGGAGDSSGVDKYERQLEKMSELAANLESKIVDETGTALQKGAAKLTAEAVKMQEDINDAMDVGIDVTAVQGALDRYKQTVTDSLEKTWREAWRDLKNQSAEGHAQLLDDANAEADAEYQITKTRLDKEREDKLKEVQRDKNDKEALLAVDQWYNDELALADRERIDTKRDNNLKAYDQAMEHNSLLVDLEGKTQSEIDAMNRQELASKIAYMRQELETATLTKEARLELERELSDGIQQQNKLASTNLADSWAIAIKDIQDQQTNFADIMKDTWSDIDSATSGHFKAMFTGAESMSEGIKGTILDLKNSILEMFAEILYQKYILGPLSNWFTGFLGGFGGGSSSGEGGSEYTGHTFDFLNEFADGGNYPGGLALVGEEGPELIDFKRGGHVYTANETKGMTTGKQPITVQMHIHGITDTNSFKQSQGQIVSGAGRAIQRAVGRNG